MIWVDITNLPHVLFFESTIKKRSPLVTARQNTSLLDLLRDKGISYIPVGRHGGKEPKRKLVESAHRVAKLAKIVSKAGVALAVSKHSVEMPRVAFGLSIPCLQVFDNEYAEHQNRLTLPLCTKILVPHALDVSRLLEQGAEKHRITRFNGLCELAHVLNFEPGRRTMEEYVLVRPEPRHAAYFRKKGVTQEIINAVSEDYKVLVLPRMGERYKNADVPNTRDSLSLIYNASAFIGGGGTMNRESALLGTPTISYYPQELLGVDKFLIKKKLLTHRSKTKDIPSVLEEIVEKKEVLRARARKLREGMEDPITALEEEINSLTAQP